MHEPPPPAQHLQALAELLSGYGLQPTESQLREIERLVLDLNRPAIEGEKAQAVASATRNLQSKNGRLFSELRKATVELNRYKPRRR